MKEHELKTWPIYFYRIYCGQKKFEIRRNDRDFEIGDHLELREFDPIKKEYTGRVLFVKVDYILKGPAFGIEDGFVAMSISIIS